MNRREPGRREESVAVRRGQSHLVAPESNLGAGTGLDAELFAVQWDMVQAGCGSSKLVKVGQSRSKLVKVGRDWFDGWPPLDSGWRFFGNLEWEVWDE